MCEGGREKGSRLSSPSATKMRFFQRSSYYRWLSLINTKFAYIVLRCLQCLLHWRRWVSSSLTDDIASFFFYSLARFLDGWVHVGLPRLSTPYIPTLPLSLFAFLFLFLSCLPFFFFAVTSGRFPMGCFDGRPRVMIASWAISSRLRLDQ